MEELIKRVFEEKMKNGEIEKIISSRIDKLVLDVCDSLMSYGGEIKNYVKEKISPILIKAVDDSDFNYLSTKVVEIFNENIQSSGLAQLENIRKSVALLLNGDDIPKKSFEKISVKELFEHYKKYVKESIQEDDVESTLEEGEDYKYTEIEVTMEIKDCNSFFNDQKVIIFSNEVADDEDNDASRYSKFEIQLYKSYNGNYMLDFNDRIPFSRLSTLPEFIIYLIKLKNYSCIIELDTYYQSDTVELEYEYEYERS